MTDMQREADGVADVVLALADDFLAIYGECGDLDPDEVYDWLVAQAAAIRQVTS